MTVYTFDEQIVSDLHKDARGYRPSNSWWQMWNALGDAEKQNVWDGLLNELDVEMTRERKDKARASLALTERLEQMYQLGAKTEVQALQWIMEAEEFSDIDLQYGASYFCFHFGLSYSAEKEFPIQEAINQMISEVV